MTHGVRVNDVIVKLDETDSGKKHLPELSEPWLRPFHLQLAELRVC